MSHNKYFGPIFSNTLVISRDQTEAYRCCCDVIGVDLSKVYDTNSEVVQKYKGHEWRDDLLGRRDLCDHGNPILKCNDYEVFLVKFD